MKLHIGDKVVLRCIAFKGKHKIQDQWENTIFKVVHQPVEGVQFLKSNPLKGMTKLKAKVAHCNLLLLLHNDFDNLESSGDSETHVSTDSEVIKSDTTTLMKSGSSLFQNC